MRPFQTLSASLLIPLNVLILLMCLYFSFTHARATDDAQGVEYEETARVVRVSLLRGEVSLRRAGNQTWEQARLNLPLVEGDTLATGRDARLEIQVDARNFVRVGPDSVLRIVTLRDAGIALSLDEGTATVRLARFETEREYFEVDAPKTTLAAERQGIYRLDVARDGGVRITVRDGGRARIYSETSGFTLRDKRTARLIYSGDAAGDWELSSASAFDDWDSWTDERERYLASRLRHEDRERYYDREVWGAEELDAYGDWTQTKDYGWVWRPHITVINNYSNWAPYRYGRWTWCPPYGWTWVGDEDWGWAPYHYGRWVHYNNSWCWAPRVQVQGRSWWRPALVAFVYVPTSYGEHVAWYPLNYGQRDPHSRRWRHHPERLSPLGAQDVVRLERTNPAYLRAVSAVPVREFGAASLRARPASIDVARRAFTSDPVRGRLQVPPNNSDSNVTTDANGRTRLNVIRRATQSPARPVIERSTGAAPRAPGVPLDGELRRARVFGGREPRIFTPVPSSPVDTPRDANTPDTGAILRPARPNNRGTAAPRPDGSTESLNIARPAARPNRRADSMEERSPVPRTQPDGVQPGDQPRSEPRERRTGARERRGRDENPDNGDPNVTAPGSIARPARPVEPQPDENRPSSPPVEARPARRERRPESMDSPTPRDEQLDRIEQPERRERPTRRERAEPREERQPAPAPAPAEERPEPRDERPQPRYERREPREERPAPRREEPAPQPEPPPSRSEPPARSQPEPQPPPRSAEPERERPAPARPARPSRGGPDIS
ncbi:MAG: FecR domain-containing protein [Pyrinomonadaceae bacterium]|nr:FecR domain-containing protein [Pyrinomonadaceae bacterium]